MVATSSTPSSPPRHDPAPIPGLRILENGSSSKSLTIFDKILAKKDTPEKTPVTQKRPASKAETTKKQGKKVMKKPAAKNTKEKECSVEAIASHDMETDTKNLTRKSTESKPVERKRQKNWGPPSDQLDPRVPEQRALLRRRLDSDAWHSTYKAEIAKKIDNEKAHELAREAAKAAREAFDHKQPKPTAKAKASAKAKSKPSPKAKSTEKPSKKKTAKTQGDAVQKEENKDEKTGTEETSLDKEKENTSERGVDVD